ncbi:MAG: diaminopimelate epimerase [Lachnospiraceae bacterium]
MRFTKMHGLGNDYVYVNCTEETIKNPKEMAQRISDRHRGIGADGLILICSSQVADFKMKMYNLDGSQGKMCGNGIRCVAKYVYDHHLTRKTTITIETLSGIKTVQMFLEHQKVANVTVDMGVPIILAINEPIKVLGMEYQITELSMGNPHAVIYQEDIYKLNLQKIGPQLEYHRRFRERTNIEVAHRIDAHCVEMRVWERGAGETMACGTGACAVAVASVLNHLTDREITIRLLGGDLFICWKLEDGHVYMTGPATTVFEGILEEES